MKLSNTQLATGKLIVAIGKQLGKESRDIRIAIEVAEIETSLGENKRKNPKSSASGLYQYTKGAWHDRHRARGNPSDDEAAIRAFYADIDSLKGMYQRDKKGTAAGLSFDEYVYGRHMNGYFAHDISDGVHVYRSRKSETDAATEEVIDSYEEGQSKSEIDWPGDRRGADGGEVFVHGYVRGSGVEVSDYYRDWPHRA
jgi:hypothetical protein